jgi:hypothetical protein
LQAKINEEKQNRKNKDGNVKSVTTWEKRQKKHRSRFLQEYESKKKKSYALEDGHVGRNM